MKKALAVLLSFIIGLLPLCALGEVSDTILIDTSFTLRENQSEHMILFDKDGNPMNISLGISPPHLQDLFESPYLYDPSAFNDGGYYETTGALHSPSIVLQSTPDWIYSENK